jgi:SAM-dependent methyltransferase
MLGRRSMPVTYHQWNAQHGAPFGRQILITTADGKNVLSREGIFTHQGNNTTREWEYPWAFYATPIEAGMNIIEIGGAQSGFQFVLDKAGCMVYNVDPGNDAAKIMDLNQKYGANVVPVCTTIDKAGLPAGQFDRIFSISVLEHCSPEDFATAIRYSYDLLKPGGFLIATVDLFLNLFPFSDRMEYAAVEGRNQDINEFIKAAPFELVQGEKAELYGFPEFEHRKIMARLEEFLIGVVPAMASCLVLRKPA